ncbi:hypothetical protein CL620_05360, partial [archaeon]|nr:hypothetical protein [archaeon]
MDIYEPAEDSFLLQKQLPNYLAPRVLDMGTGSGIQALTAAKHSVVRNIVAADINPDAILALQKETALIKKIKPVVSNLFENVSGEFDLIIFNPPYLPQDEGIVDPALYGGKEGWELSERFFATVSPHLRNDGVILYLFSTLTNKEKIESILNEKLFEFEEVASEKLSFETLFVYAIRKSTLLRELEKQYLRDIQYFTKGQRGMIYTGTQDRSMLVKTHLPSKKNVIKVAVKTQNEASFAIGRIENEINWMKRLNKEGIGPLYLFSGENYVVYKFVEGEFILGWITKNGKDDILTVLNELLRQCYIMDEMQVNKEEMHHPHKH